MWGSTYLWELICSKYPKSQVTEKMVHEAIVYCTATLGQNVKLWWCWTAFPNMENLSLSVADQADTYTPDIFNNHLSFPSLHLVVYLFREEGDILPCVFCGTWFCTVERSDFSAVMKCLGVRICQLFCNSNWFILGPNPSPSLRRVTLGYAWPLWRFRIAFYSQTKFVWICW